MALLSDTAFNPNGTSHNNGFDSDKPSTRPAVVLFYFLVIVFVTIGI